jgi:hypothetical protein
MESHKFAILENVVHGGRVLLMLIQPPGLVLTVGVVVRLSIGLPTFGEY